MTHPPANISWIGFTKPQLEVLAALHLIGNNGWSRTRQTNDTMPKLLDRAAAEGLTVTRIKEAMAAAGHSQRALHQLERWESKRTTGNFGC